VLLRIALTNLSDGSSTRYTRFHRNGEWRKMVSGTSPLNDGLRSEWRSTPCRMECHANFSPETFFAATSHLYNCVLLVMLMSPYSHLQARNTQLRKTGPSVYWVYKNFLAPYMLRVLCKRRNALTKSRFSRYDKLGTGEIVCVCVCPSAWFN
jgi:hypothetical protein